MYIVPGIRKKTRKLAAALAKNVTPLSSLSDLISDTTQLEDTMAMSKAIERLPKRVVVLVDEVDRMDTAEISTLLKIMRGIPFPANMSFVYAGDRQKMEEAVAGQFNNASHLYFEKFFPVSLSLTSPDSALLLQIATRRITAELKRRGWFSIPADEEEFTKKIQRLWPRCLSPFLRTLREIGLLAENVGLTAGDLLDEVNPVDLTLLELIRQFEPAIYESIWEYRETLTEGEDWTSPTYAYRTDEEKKQVDERFLQTIRDAEPDTGRYDAVRRMLKDMFPRFADIDKEASGLGFREKREKRKRLSDPDLFPAYFHYSLPQDIFSQRELTAFVKQISKPGADIDATLASTLNSMEKGGRKRADFLNKLADEIENLDPPLAEKVGLACMSVADQLSYDTFFSTGEAGHVLRIVLRTAMKLVHQKRVAFLAECVRTATDDSMSFRIQTALTKPGQDFNLEVRFSELYSSFVQHMRARYGIDVDVQTVNLKTSDQHAFNLWGMREIDSQGEITVPKPEEREIQYDFWQRYIGKSRNRLAECVGQFFFPHGLYDSDPVPFVENKISVALLRELYETTQPEPELTPSEEKEIKRLRNLLSGRFEKGVRIGDTEADDEYA